ncbi:hypothetical protein PN836_016580 [Ningiella sp. W23]|uniref:hypothetical protein n=1 Tax=Ningiella sp. W23 TaxID=3023715 RepID=UPI0037576867
MIINKEVLASALYFDKSLLENKSEGELENIRKLRYRELLYSRYDLPHIAEDFDTIFFRSLSRQDYKEFFSTIYESYEAKKIMICDFERSSNSLNGHALTTLLIYGEQLSSIISEQCELKLDCLLFRLAKYVHIARNILTLSFKRIVFFSDHQPVEFLLSSICNDLGIRTCSVQHGLYVEYKGIDTVNKINYMFQPSHYFLSWGSETKELIEKYNKHANVIRCGKPHIFLPNGSDVCSKPFINLILDQPLFEKQNLQMIDLVTNYCLSYSIALNVRCHPGKQISKYDLTVFKGCELYTDLKVEDAELSVGHSSSFLFELLALGCPVAQYKTASPTIDLPVKMQFTDALDMKAIFSLVKDLSKCELQTISERYFAKVNAESLMLYRKFFRKFAGEEMGSSIERKLVEIGKNQAFQNTNWLCQSILVAKNVNPSAILIDVEEHQFPKQIANYICFDKTGITLNDETPKSWHEAIFGYIRFVSIISSQKRRMASVEEVLLKRPIMMHSSYKNRLKKILKQLELFQLPNIRLLK